MICRTLSKTPARMCSRDMLELLGSIDSYTMTFGTKRPRESELGGIGAKNEIVVTPSIVA